jgi:hypothetical protein
MVSVLDQFRVACTPPWDASSFPSHPITLVTSTPSLLTDTVPLTKDTALHLAIRTGHVGLVVCLLNLGAKVDTRNARGWSPVDEARAAGRRSLVLAVMTAVFFSAGRDMVESIEALKSVDGALFRASLRWSVESYIPMVSWALPSSKKDTVWRVRGGFRLDSTLLRYERGRNVRGRKSILVSPWEADPLKRIVVLHHDDRKAYLPIADLFNPDLGDLVAMATDMMQSELVGVSNMRVTNASLVPTKSWRGHLKETVIAGTQASVFAIKNAVFTATRTVRVGRALPPNPLETLFSAGGADEDDGAALALVSEIWEILRSKDTGATASARAKLNTSRDAMYPASDEDDNDDEEEEESGSRSGGGDDEVFFDAAADQGQDQDQEQDQAAPEPQAVAAEQELTHPVDGMLTTSTITRPFSCKATISPDFPVSIADAISLCRAFVTSGSEEKSPEFEYFAEVLISLGAPALPLALHIPMGYSLSAHYQVDEFESLQAREEDNHLLVIPEGYTVIQHAPPAPKRARRRRR